jgi:hypothetical protein
MDVLTEWFDYWTVGDSNDAFVGQVLEESLRRHEKRHDRINEFFGISTCIRYDIINYGKSCYTSKGRAYFYGRTNVIKYIVSVAVNYIYDLSSRLFHGEDLTTRDFIDETARAARNARHYGYVKERSAKECVAFHIESMMDEMRREDCINDEILSKMKHFQGKPEDVIMEVTAPSFDQNSQEKEGEHVT